MAAEDPMFNETVLVVRHRTRPADAVLIYDRRGRRLAAVSRTAAPGLRVVGIDGQVLLTVTPPPMIVADGAGTEVGRIVPEIVFGRTRFALRSDGRRCGSVHAGDLRGWKFDVLDDAGAEVARITTTVRGRAGQSDRNEHGQVLEIRRPLPQPLRGLVVAAVLAMESERR